ncbi:procyclic surface glycoprotein, PSSA-2, putative [Bodo saltans]|uniref:Procyclic surface glycoprotein, PSSA-2, putative n=1 Tax=Bodo saltans TaxID=75058 RepID=A0A0S4IT58_BODSA|nr:procyclic surface glycoprotein, PSSA-2, putative [Bodo saltans]|eukprot:CUF80579.1 procyclic surface glycoprotein, PSSA-2, putative [Bodo saltans]
MDPLRLVTSTFSRIFYFSQLSLPFIHLHRLSQKEEQRVNTMCFELFSPCGVCEAAGSCVRMVIGCLCCIFLGGPVLFIVGIVLLVSDNNRADYVATYNKAVVNFDTSGMATWSSTGTMGETASPASFAMQTAPVVIYGDLEDVNQNGVSTFGDNSITYPASTTPSLTFSATTSTPFTRSSVQTLVTYSSSVRCRTSFGSCSTGDMQTLCQNDAGSGAVYTGPSCFDGDTCGTCTNTQYLSVYCAVLQRSSGAWVESTAHASCLYPFGANSQTFDAASVPSNLELQLYADDDPLIVLEAVTFGTRDFGVTKGHQRRMGVILMIIGIFVTIAVCGGLCCICRSVSRDHRRRGNNNFEDNTPMEPQPFHHHHHHHTHNNQLPNKPSHHNVQGVPIDANHNAYGQPAQGGGYEYSNNVAHPHQPDGVYAYGQPPQGPNGYEQHPQQPYGAGQQQQQPYNGDQGQYYGQPQQVHAPPKTHPTSHAPTTY